MPFTPYWPTPAACSGIFIPIASRKNAGIRIKRVSEAHHAPPAPIAKWKKAGIRIKRVPEAHRALSAFCETASQQLKLKLTYCGESSAMLCHKFIQLLLVRRRETISDKETQHLLAQQNNRCDQCGDLLKKFERHHRQAVAEGGSNSPENIVLLCPQCHAQETEKQQQAGNKSAVWLKSHLSPRMTQLFRMTPRPRQLVWGDTSKQSERLRACDDFEPVQCFDVVGCRSNVLMERTTSTARRLSPGRRRASLR